MYYSTKDWNLFHFNVKYKQCVKTRVGYRLESKFNGFNITIICREDKKITSGQANLESNPAAVDICIMNKTYTDTWGVIQYILVITSQVI